MAAEVLGAIDFSTLTREAQLLFAMCIPTFMQFSTATIESIRARDMDKEGRSVCKLCRTIIATGHGHVAHINHNKNAANYDNKSNGRVLCETCHYIDHVNRAGRNGVMPYFNRALRQLLPNKFSDDFALRQLWNKVPDENKVKLLSPDQLIKIRNQKHPHQGYGVVLPFNRHGAQV